MNRSALRSLLVQAFAAAAFFFFLPPSGAEQPPTRPAHIQKLVREAEAAFDRLDIALARQLWAQIHELEHTNVAMCQLGQLDRRMDRWVDAVDELERCVARMEPPETPREQRLYETRHEDLAVARQHVAEVAVLAPPGATAVLVGGRRVDKTGRIYVAPGQHEVSAALPDGQVVSTTVSAPAGESRTALLAPPAATASSSPVTEAFSSLISASCGCSGSVPPMRPGSRRLPPPSCWEGARSARGRTSTGLEWCSMSSSAGASSMKDRLARRTADVLGSRSRTARRPRFAPRSR
ncbi:tetratricopeptide repeat protein [Sorangium sp. So ce269]